MRTSLSIALAWLLLGATGCFILDEIDKGQAIMKHNSPEGEKAAPADAGKSESGGLSLAAWRERSAGAIEDISGKVEEALAPEPHPDNVVISCAIDGRTEFTRKFDCQTRGGRVLQR